MNTETKDMAGCETTLKFSVKDAVHDFLRSRKKTWVHNRASTIGASEIGQCARRVWFDKNGVAKDVGSDELKGAAYRGDVIEAHVWNPAMETYVAKMGGVLHHAGDAQETFVDGYLSATADGIVTGLGPDFLMDCKSIDPRVNLQEAKSEHFAQMQIGMGVLKSIGKFNPEYAILSYIDASFFDEVNEFRVDYDPSIYANAKRRALAIMDAQAAIEIRPEGKMSGGKECAYCPWASACANEQVSNVPEVHKFEVTLESNAAMALEDASLRAIDAAEAEKAAKVEGAAAKEEIKEILRAHGARKTSTDAVSVSWSTVKGRKTFDSEAAMAAGIDLSAFTKEGDASERLTLKRKD